MPTPSSPRSARPRPRRPRPCLHALLAFVVHAHAVHETREVGCFRKCLFGVPQNTEFYTEFTLFRVFPYRFVNTEFRIPSNENSKYKKLKKSTKVMVYVAEFRGIPLRFVYTEFRLPLNVVCAASF
jgi:hypothetical protein